VAREDPVVPIIMEIEDDKKKSIKDKAAKPQTAA
jgi:hypothetical protein